MCYRKTNVFSVFYLSFLFVFFLRQKRTTSKIKIYVVSSLDCARDDVGEARNDKRYIVYPFVMLSLSKNQTLSECFAPTSHKVSGFLTTSF